MQRYQRLCLDPHFSDNLETWNDFTCYVSPEIIEHLNLNGVEFLWVSVNRTIPWKLVLIRQNDHVMKNCVALPYYKSQPYVWIDLCSSPCPKLNKVMFVVQPSEMEMAKNIVMTWLEDNESFPIQEGGVIQVHEKNNDIKLLVEQSEPFVSGSCNKETKIILKPSLKESHHELKNVALFSLRILPRRVTEDKMKELQFPYAIAEMPLELASELLENVPNLDPCSTIFVKDVENGCFCVIKSPSGRSLLLNFFQTSFVFPCRILASPSLLQYLNEYFEDEDCFQLLQAPDNLVTIGDAEKMQISFLKSSTYNSLSVKETDSLISNFFSEKKYILPQSIIELPIAKFADGDSLHLKWQLLEETSLFFKCRNQDKDGFCSEKRIGVYVDRTKCSLFQQKMIRDSLPSQTMRYIPNSVQYLLSLPPFLAEAHEEILFSIKAGAGHSFLVIGPFGSGKSDLYSALKLASGFSLVEADCRRIVSDSSGGTEAKLRQTLATAEDEIPCILLLRNIEEILKNRDGDIDLRVADRLQTELERIKINFNLVVIGDSYVKKDKIPREIACLFDALVEIPVFHKDPQMTADVIKWIMKEQALVLSSDLNPLQIAQRTPGYLLEDYRALARKARYANIERLGSQFKRFTPKINRKDLDKALVDMQKIMTDSIGAPKVPSVRWEDVGGLANAKREILDAIQMPLQHPELLKSGFKRSGLLLYGPPGVGKTLLAKAVATEFGLNFFSVKGPELLNMYVGQSEENVREIFARGKSAVPCVIFFDELDSLAPNRGRSGDSGGVMDRVVSQLMAEMDDLGQAGLIFVIGATNRPDLIDPALLRPGRFDRLIYLGVAQDKDEQRKILLSLTRKMKTSEDFSIDLLLEKIPANLSGADLYALASNANLGAISRHIQVIEMNNDANYDDVRVYVTNEDFENALLTLTPSVSPEDLKYYDSLQKSVR